MPTSRFTALGEPSSSSKSRTTTAIGPTFLAAFMDYYRDDLQVDTDREYVVSGDLWHSWDWKHEQPDIPAGFEPPFPDTLVDLSLAKSKNDLATFIEID